MTTGRPLRQPERGGRFGESQAGEVPKFNELCLERVVGCEAIECFVECDEIFLRFECRSEVGGEFQPNAIASVPDGRLLASRVDQNAPHRFRRRREEMPSAVPTNFVGGAEQPEIRLVNEGRGLKRLIGRLGGHSYGGEFPQLVVNERK